MTNADYLNLFAACCAAMSAVLWAFASRVKIRTGYDMDQEMAEDFTKAAKLNSAGAAFASGAAVCATISTAAKFVPWLSFFNQ